MVAGPKFRVELCLGSRLGPCRACKRKHFVDPFLKSLTKLKVSPGPVVVVVVAAISSSSSSSSRTRTRTRTRTRSGTRTRTSHFSSMICQRADIKLPVLWTSDEGNGQSDD